MDREQTLKPHTSSSSQVSGVPKGALGTLEYQTLLPGNPRFPYALHTSASAPTPGATGPGPRILA